MKLIQLNQPQLETLIQSGTKPSGIAFIDESIPPAHVLNRSIDLMHDSIDETWALPYFIQKGTHVIGCCGFKSAPSQRRIEIGYNVAPDARGLGVATSAIKLLSDIAFKTELVNTIVARIVPDNIASISVVKKNGFVFKQLSTVEDGISVECWELNQDKV